jgi:hypothetical protein
MNDGDWVESCTALVEHMDGRIEIIDWAKRVAALHRLAEAPPVPEAEPEPAEPAFPPLPAFA